MKKLLKGLLIIAMALTVTACGGDDKEVENKETKTLTIGTSPDYEPYESLTKNNEIVGFDVDMVALFEKYLLGWIQSRITFLSYFLTTT